MLCAPLRRVFHSKRRHVCRLGPMTFMRTNDCKMMLGFVPLRGGRVGRIPHPRCSTTRGLLRTFRTHARLENLDEIVLLLPSPLWRKSDFTIFGWNYVEIFRHAAKYLLVVVHPVKQSFTMPISAHPEERAHELSAAVASLKTVANPPGVSRKAVPSGETAEIPKHRDIHGAIPCSPLLPRCDVHISWH